ncbi:hypothetical protein F5883DRAFT_3568 [Diaporthe sp. PMI_573]|nr:hypothetical protein F5883DRAFT_3568 [Diaporthaceae sp. PMI_573]
MCTGQSIPVNGIHSSCPVHAPPSSPAVVSRPTSAVPAPCSSPDHPPFSLGVFAVVVAVAHAPDVLDAEHRPRDVPPPLPPQGPAPGHGVGPPRRGNHHPGCDAGLGAAVVGLVLLLLLILLCLDLDVVGPPCRGLPLLVVFGVFLDGVALVEVLPGRRDVVQLPLLLDVGLRVAAQHGREGEQHLQEDGDVDDDEGQAQEGDAHGDEARHGGHRVETDNCWVGYCGFLVSNIQIAGPGQVKGETRILPWSSVTASTVIWSSNQGFRNVVQSHTGIIALR